MELSGSLRLDENFVERLDRREPFGLMLSSTSATGSSDEIRWRVDLRGILFYCVCKDGGSISTTRRCFLALLFRFRFSDSLSRFDECSRRN